MGGRTPVLADARVCERPARLPRVVAALERAQPQQQQRERNARLLDWRVACCWASGGRAEPAAVAEACAL